jgi:hypothetical protein
MDTNDDSIEIYALADSLKMILKIHKKSFSTTAPKHIKLIIKA